MDSFTQHMIAYTCPHLLVTKKTKNITRYFVNFMYYRQGIIVDSQLLKIFGQFYHIEM